ncbi:MAG: elongation factor P [Thermoguttaceae bacterium]|nr:elongation factor P [Thermoguttaceae bacterium]
MLLAKEMKPGSIVNYNDAPCCIEGVNVQSPSARGAATLYKFRARNMLTKTKVDFTLKGTDTMDEADFGRRESKFSYSDGTNCCFMDQESYEQYEIRKEDVAEEMKYLTEEMDLTVHVLLYNGQPIGIQLPAVVELTITETTPRVKGNSATDRAKPAKLETGLTILVPEYIEQGEKVRVDTRTGEFSGRT